MESLSSKAVFLSYASQDAEAARRLADALCAAGVEVWFDQSELRGGDAWDAKIREQVESCTLFVPIISAHTQARREGYFRLEWNLADERTHLMAGGTPFLLPVVIDDTKERGALVPKSFLGVQWSRLPGGETPSAFVQRVQGLLGATATPGRTSSGPGTGAPAPEVAPRRGVPIWTVATVIVVVLGLGTYLALRPTPQQTPAPVAAARPTADTKTAPLVPAGPRNGPKSIAVLPFTNMSEDKDASAFFADGVHDDILTNLALVHELYVTSRTTVMQYRDTKKTLRQIGEELGVAYVLEGSVRRDAKRVRITGQLIRADTDGHLWAEKFDRDLTDMFAIQAEIATVIAGKLQAVISPLEKRLIERRPTGNLAAYDLYLKERALRNRTDPEWSIGSIPEKREALLNAAVKLDPNFAEAWAGLGEVLAEGYRWRSRTTASLTKAKAAIDNAVRLAPDLPEVIIAQGLYFFIAERDLEQAAAQAERARRLFPNNAGVYGLLARIAASKGREADSEAYIRDSLRLDPGNKRGHTALSTHLLEGRRFAEARSEFQRQQELYPGDIYLGYRHALCSFLASGSTREVEQFFSKLPEKEATSSEGVSLRRNWALRTGNFAETMRPIEMRTNDNQKTVTSRGRGFYAALFLAAQGDLAAARAELGGIDAVRSARDKEPDLPARWSTLARWEALLGNKEEALRCARRAVELEPESDDPRLGARNSVTLAFVYAWTGDKDRAIAEYARLLRVSWAGLNVHEMKRHPEYALLRGDPRFEALLNDPKNNAPLF